MTIIHPFLPCINVVFNVLIYDMVQSDMIQKVQVGAKFDDGSAALGAAIVVNRVRTVAAAATLPPNPPHSNQGGTEAKAVTGGAAVLMSPNSEVDVTPEVGDEPTLTKLSSLYKRCVLCGFI